MKPFAAPAHGWTTPEQPLFSSAWSCAAMPAEGPLYKNGNLAVQLNLMPPPAHPVLPAAKYG